MTRGTQTAAHKIAEGLQEALAIAKGEAEPHRWHNLTTPIPSQDGKTESEGLASAPVTEQPETANDIRTETARCGLSEVTLPTTCEEQPLSGGEGTQGTGSASEPGSIPGQSTHSEQARVSSTALAADPAKPLPLGSWVGHPFNDQGKVA